MPGHAGICSASCSSSASFRDRRRQPRPLPPAAKRAVEPRKDPTMSEENKAIYQRYMDFLNTGDESILSEVVAEDCVDHNPFPRQAPGRAGCLQAGHMLRQALPDLKATVEDIV